MLTICAPAKGIEHAFIFPAEESGSRARAGGLAVWLVRRIADTSAATEPVGSRIRRSRSDRGPWLIIGNVSLASFDSPHLEGPVAPDLTQPQVIVRTNTDSARARAADAEGKTLSWLAEQEWFDRSAFTKYSIRVGPQPVLGLWPPPWENREPGRVSLTLHRITDDELSILITLQEEATYQKVERVLLQLANGESPEADFTIESYRPWTYAASTSDAALRESAPIDDPDELATVHFEGREVSAVHRRMLANSGFRSGHICLHGQVDNTVPTPMIGSSIRTSWLLNRPPASLEFESPLRTDGADNQSASDSVVPAAFAVKEDTTDESPEGEGEVYTFDMAR